MELHHVLTMNESITLHRDFAHKSRSMLMTCHPYLILLANKVIEIRDISIRDGHRTQALQDKYFDEGTTQKKWPDGMHNKLPSLAMDIYPYPYPRYWDSRQLDEQMRHLGGIVMGVSHYMGLNIRWGGDWDSDGDFENQELKDMAHFELIL